MHRREEEEQKKQKKENFVLSSSLHSKRTSQPLSTYGYIITHIRTHTHTQINAWKLRLLVNVPKLICLPKSEI